MNKKAIFWLVVGFLVVIDGGLIVYQFIFNKPKADVISKPNAADIRQFNLLPTNNPNINAPLVNFSNATKIYTPEANFFYSSPVLLKRDEDNLLFLARGQASVKYDEIVYSKSTDLTTWTQTTSIKKFANEKLVDLFGTRASFGYYLFYITQDQNQKYATSYLYSKDGTNWKEKTINVTTDNLIKGAAMQDQNSLRVILLDTDKRTVKQSFVDQKNIWTPLTVAIKLNLQISDLDLFKSTDYYYLLFSSNNVLYETGSIDFHTFNEPVSILTLKDNNFNLGNVGITTEVNDGVYLNNSL